MSKEVKLPESGHIVCFKEKFKGGDLVFFMNQEEGLVGTKQVNMMIRTVDGYKINAESGMLTVDAKYIEDLGVDDFIVFMQEANFLVGTLSENFSKMKATTDS